MHSNFSAYPVVRTLAETTTLLVIARVDDTDSECRHNDFRF